MWGVFGSFSTRLAKEKSFIDNTTFRLHYRVTFVVLLVASLLSTLYAYIGDPINCIAQGVPGGLMNTYCWIHGTFTIPARLTGNVGVNFAHPGVGPTTDFNLIRVTEDGDEIRHAWYQWVCFVLFGQALLCYLPHYIWKSFEGGKIKMMIQDLDEINLKDPDTKTDRRMAAVNYFIRTVGTHQLYVAKYVFCEALNFVNLLLQMYFMDFFLGGQFSTYGLDVLAVSEEPFEERTDPMSKVFPKVTKCTFNNYGASGTVEVKDGLCVLAINIINEKIYIFLWFWFVTVLAWTGIHLLMRFLSIASSAFRDWELRMFIKFIMDRRELTILSSRAKGNHSSDLKSVLRKCRYGDWFILMQLVKHFDPAVFSEFIIDLRDGLNAKRDDNVNVDRD